MAIETFHTSISPEPVASYEGRLELRDYLGADIRFLGIVRALENDQPITGIRYTCYQEMAEQELRRICETLQEESPTPHRTLIHHQTGFVAAGDASIVIRVQTPHSAAGFALCQEYLKRIKETVPIWKEPVWA